MRLVRVDLVRSAVAHQLSPTTITDLIWSYTDKSHGIQHIRIFEGQLGVTVLAYTTAESAPEAELVLRLACLKALANAPVMRGWALGS